MTENYQIFKVCALLFCFSIAIQNCDNKSSMGVEESLSAIPDLVLIEEAINSAVTVNSGSDSYFSLELHDISPNNIISEGKGNGWCIAWNKPIASDNTTHQRLNLYSTHGSEKWKSINYLLNTKSNLKQQDPDLTYREIQVAIWYLLDFPAFDLDQISIDDLPSRMVRNSEYNFDLQKVMQIVQHVNQNYQSFQYNSASTFAVVVETHSDTQTIIIEVNESVWAYGQHSFRSQELRDHLGITGEGRGQWGWIYEMETEYASTELIAGVGDDDGTKAVDEVGTIIGNLEMMKGNDQLEITYSTFSGYLINDLHLWVGCSLNDFPVVGQAGNVAPGQLPYSYDDEPTDSHTFRIPLTDLKCEDNHFIAAHAGELFQVKEIDAPSEPHIVIEIIELSIFEETAADRDDPSGGHFVDETDARAINDEGMIVGNQWLRVCTDELCNDYFEENQGFRWSTQRGLESIPLYSISSLISNLANDINAIGEVVGYSNLEGAAFLEYPLTIQSPTELIGGLLGGNPWESIALAINDHSQVVGYASNAMNQQRAFIWDKNNGMVDLGTLAGQTVSIATDINNSGQVVGSSGGRYFIWDKQSGMTDLGTDPVRSINDYGVTSSHIAINNYGQTVNGGFLYDPKLGPIDLGTIPGWGNCRALDLNNKGQIVGSCFNPSVGWHRAVKWNVTFDTDGFAHN